MKKSFGLFLKEKRQEKKFTQKQLANILFVSESAVSKWESDVAHPDITLLPKLSEILGVTEHELITASIDNETRENKVQAKKWRIVSFSWNLFFYISYAVALLVCFICNLAIEGTLSWFWIVLFCILLAFNFTSLPKLIKKHKLVLLPLSMYLTLCFLLAVCCIYADGNWFWLASISVLLGLLIVFVPIYIAKFKMFSKIKKYNDFVSIGVDFILLNILLIVVDSYTAINYSINHWYFSIAFIIVLSVYLILNLFLCVRFLKFNRLIKTSIILFGVNLLYILAQFIKSNDPGVQQELNDISFYQANFLNWQPDICLEKNIHCIIFISILILAIIFLIAGIIRYKKYKREKV